MREAPGEELPFGVVERVGVVVDATPVVVEDEPATAEQGGVVAVAVLPHLRGAGEFAMDREARPVGVDPSAQPVPRGEEDLVAQLDGILVDRQEPGVGETVDDLVHGVDVPERQFAAGSASSCLGVVVDVDETQEHPARESLLFGGQFRVQLLGGLLDRAGDTADRGVIGDGERPALGPLPQPQQRVGQQGECAGLVLRPRRAGSEVGQQHLHQLRWNGHPRLGRRLHDDGFEFGSRHGTDDDGPGLQDRYEVRFPSGEPVEVGPEPEDDDDVVGRLREVFEEVVAVLFLPGGPQFLELVDDENGRVIDVENAGEFVRSCRRGGQDDGFPVAEIGLVGIDGGRDTGPQQRRLARTGGTDDEDHPRTLPGDAARIRRRTSSVMSSRPKNHSASSASKEDRPR